MGTSLPTRALTTECCCLCLWARCKDYFQLYDVSTCVICSRSVHFHFGPGLYILPSYAFSFRNTWVSKWLPGDFGCILQESCAKEVQKPQEFPTRRNLKKTQIIYESVGKQPTHSHSQLSKTKKDFVFISRALFGILLLSFSKSFFSCWSALGTDQIMVVTAVYRVCNGQSQSSATLVCMHSVLLVRQGGWITCESWDVKMGIRDRESCRQELNCLHKFLC